METIERLFQDLKTKSPQRFSSTQIQAFTSNFTEKLGSGAFGEVYKGVLHNGMLVAVKVLNLSLLTDGIKDQFRAEVSVLGNTHHRNLVKLWGFCFEDNMKAIVYEFMENESLDKLLYGNQRIEWETLCNIVTGTTNGLSYLHRDCEPRIIHYDIKPSNILLDSKFSPKVGDFGLAKLLNQDKSHITESRFRGTPVYVAPELSMPYSSITHKCDVYSYGITLFDIIGRRRHLIGEGQKWFPSHVWMKFEKQQHEELMRECGIQKKHREQAKRMLLIALLCVQFLPEHRPSMSHVVRLLEGREEIELPPNPFLYLGSSGSQIEGSTSKIEGEEALGMAKRRLERERGWREAMSDMSEDLSEGEKGSISADDSRRGRMHKISSVDGMDSLDKLFKERKIYIVLISLHGLICGQDMELGRDSDTRGRVKYVVELARALGTMPGVYRVDLLTRQISAPDVHWTYGEPTEMLTPLGSEGFTHEMGKSKGAYIVRIPFGPKDKYIRKELLWPHIPEFVDGALSHIIQLSNILGEQTGAGQPVWPIAIHGHYADAGDAAALLSGALNVPMVFTSHSLGRVKLHQLLKQGRQSMEEINSMYKLMRRIEAEESSIDSSDVIITSTGEEIEEHWSVYDGFDTILENKLRARIRRGVSTYGRFMPRMVVIPPGREIHHIVPHDGETEVNEDNAASPDPPIWSEIMRFFTNARKPMILAIARPDPKKNITTLIKAFGECKPLRNFANLTLIMGNREVIDEMSSTNASILVSILKLIDKYDLYGQVAYPKHHKQSDIPSIYQLTAKTKGVFINPAFNEPFGLNLIEAAAHGLPMVATKNGDPVDIHRVLENGFLVDPLDQQAISDALLKLVTDKQLWANCRRNALKNVYLFSWPKHCKTYLSSIANCKQRQIQWKQNDEFEDSDSGSDSAGDSLRLVQGISLNFQPSVDRDKNEGSSSLLNTLDSDEDADVKSKLGNAVFSQSKGMVRDAQKPGFGGRKHIFVIAVDCDSVSQYIEIIKMIFDAAGKDRVSGSTGFILSTFMTISEINSVLVSGGFSTSDFDAFICNSGGELYYPSSNLNKVPGPSGLPVVVDLDYGLHIGYRWGGEGLRKTLVRWAASISDKKTGNEEKFVTEDEQRSTECCYAFKARNPSLSLIPHVKELRNLMRIQALRCHVIYCKNGSKLHAIPVLASRAQALRYLYVHRGADLSNMVVFTGESGDSDYGDLLGGIHKSVILKGICRSAGTRQPESSMTYSLVDVVPFDNPNIVQTANEYSTDEIRLALRQLEET